MVAGSGSPVLEESPSCAERRCLVKAREAGERLSTVQIGAPGNRCESNSNQTGRGNAYRLKRAILPAAISDPTAIRWLAEVESREQPSPARAGRSQDRER